MNGDGYVLSLFNEGRIVYNIQYNILWFKLEYTIIIIIICALLVIYGYINNN